MLIDKWVLDSISFSVVKGVEEQSLMKVPQSLADQLWGQKETLFPLEPKGKLVGSHLLCPDFTTICKIKGTDSQTISH